MTSIRQERFHPAVPLTAGCPQQSRRSPVSLQARQPFLANPIPVFGMCQDTRVQMRDFKNRRSAWTWRAWLWIITYIERT